MARLSTAPVYVSRNHLGGSFTDVPLDGIVAACLRHQVTGAIDVACGGVTGRIELRAGAIVAAQFGDATGARALRDLRQLVDGWYELTQRLPDLTGELGGTSVSEGEVERVPLKALIRHCEVHALSCTITMVSRDDRAQLTYHAGELKHVELNGFYDDDAIVQVFDWTDARFRVSAPALDLDIQGWPRVRQRAPDAMRVRFPRGTSPVGLVAVVEQWLDSDARAGFAPAAAVSRATTLPGIAPTQPSAVASTPPIAVEAPASAIPIEEMPAAASRSGFTVPARAEVLAVTDATAGRTRARRRRRVSRVSRALLLTAAIGVLLAAAVFALT